MTMTRFPTLLVLPATLWLAVSLGDKNCSITRPGGAKEPGVTNVKGECCSSFYANADDCVRPTPGPASIFGGDEHLPRFRAGISTFETDELGKRLLDTHLASQVGA
jgi:hypothetical protein